MLGLVLHHAKHLLQPRDVCTLLCTSTTAAAAVAVQFRGQLALHFAPTSLDSVVQFSRWLISNISLLRHLELDIEQLIQPSTSLEAELLSLEAVVAPANPADLDLAGMIDALLLDTQHTVHQRGPYL
jgi:hypothetical protein